MAPTKSASKSKNAGQDQWEERHSRILAHGILDLVKKHRTELYKLPGLAGEVDGHGGDRIRSKIDIMMKKLLKDNGFSVVGKKVGGSTKVKGMNQVIKVDDSD